VNWKLEGVLKRVVSRIRSSYKRKVFVNLAVLSVVPITLVALLVSPLLYRSKADSILSECEGRFRLASATIDAKVSGLIERGKLISRNPKLLELSTRSFDGKFSDLYDVYRHFRIVFAALDVGLQRPITTLYVDNDSLINGSDIKQLDHLDPGARSALETGSALWTIRTVPDFNVDATEYMLYYRKMFYENAVRIVIEMGIPMTVPADAFAYDFPPGSFVALSLSDHAVRVLKTSAVGATEAQ
jgi:hypothetical protein